MESIALALQNALAHEASMPFRRKITLINGEPFLVLPANALARLKARIGDEVKFSETVTGVMLHKVKRSPSVHRKQSANRRPINAAQKQS